MEGNRLKVPWVAIFLILLTFPASAKSFYGEVGCFANPGALSKVLELIESANESIYVASYIFTNQLIAEKIAKKKVNRILLIEAEPYGGIWEELLSYLSQNNVRVFLYDDEGIKIYHAKYMVIDNKTVLLTTENFANTGFSFFNGNRGWNCVIKSEKAAKYIAEKFLKDLEKAKKFYSSKNLRNVKKIEKHFSPLKSAWCRNASIDIFFGPEESKKLLDFLESAKEKILAEVFYVELGWEYNPINILTKKVKENVTIKVLLDGKVRKDNEKIVGILKRNGIQAKLFKNGNLSKLHAKGIIVDDAILISSFNWNYNSFHRNREIGAIIYCKNVSVYFEKLFDKDWESQEKNFTDGRILLIILLIVGFVAWLYVKFKRY
jgi:phosphatidylserine/phosphatidylglycerophosphate/cardiolipin synthase-like enzyme